MWLALKPHRRSLGAFIASVLAQVATSLWLASSLVSLVDDGVVDRTKPLREMSSSATAAAMATLVATFGTGYLVRKLSYEVEFDLRTWLYTRIHATDRLILEDLTAGQLVTRSMSDLNLVQAVIGVVPAALSIAPIVVGVGIYLTVLSPAMGVTALSALAINLLLARRLSPGLRALSTAELNERAEVTAAFDEPVRGIRVVHAFGAEEREAERVEAAAARVLRFAMGRARMLARYDLLLKSVPMVIYAAVLFVGARLVAADRLTLGTFTLAFGLVGGIAAFATAFDTLVSIWQYFIAAQRRLMEVLRLGQAPRDVGGLGLEAGIALRFDGVDAVVQGQPVIAGLDLEARPGEVTVVTGPPGSGKSMLALLAIGELTPSAGRVLLGGYDVAALAGAHVGHGIRVVVEEPFHFAGTARDALCLGAIHAPTDGTLLRALAAAGAESIIERLPDGLSSPIGDRGLTLSGGERQRLAVARALVEPPCVLILDEALSAVQPGLEQEILGRIRRHAPDTAVLYLTRRDAVQSLADVVVELPAPVRSVQPAVDAAGASPTPASPTEAPAASRTPALVAGRDEPPSGPFPPTAPTVRDVFLRPFRGLIAAALLVAVVHASGQVAPRLMLGSVSDLARDERLGQVDLRVGVLLVVAISSAIGAFGFQILSQRVSQGALYLLRRRLFVRLSRLGTDYYDREMPGQVAARVVNDIDQTGAFLSSAGFLLAVGVSQVILTLVALVVLLPSAVPAVLIAMVLLLVASIVHARVTGRALDRARAALGRAAERFEEDLTGTAELRNLGAVDLQTDRFVAAAWTLRGERRRVALLSAAYGAVIPLIGNLTAIALVVRAGNEAVAGAISVGTVLSIRLLAEAAIAPLGNAGDLYSAFLDTRVSWQRLREPFEHEIRPIEAESATECPGLDGDLELEAVAFSYPGTAREVLTDVSFRVPAGRIVAVVGHTGAGKSTISKLISRVYDPSSGRVSVGGTDLRSWNLASYRRRLAVVPQEAFVFRGTIASNIAYGCPAASRDEVRRAAAAVGADDAFERLDAGYDHPVEEGGANLTAAQRQLLALARAWMLEPEVLVLDEATSGLDPALERSVLRAVADLGCTTITVTHRRPVVDVADHVVVLRDGRVVQQGTPAGLARTGGAFAELWAAAEFTPLARPLPTPEDDDEVAVAAPVGALRGRSWSGPGSGPSHVRRFAPVYSLAVLLLVVGAVVPSRPQPSVPIGGALPLGPQTAAPGAPDGPGSTPGGTGGPGPAGETGGTSMAGAPGAVGTSRSGVPCTPGAKQLPLSSYSPPCLPAFTGDNGGATTRGVSGGKIRIVRRAFPENEFSQLGAAYGLDAAYDRELRDAWIKAFDARYELYGREIEWVDYVSRFGNAQEELLGQGREGACLDAEHIANELNAFAVMGSTSKVFAECAAQRQLVSFLVYPVAESWYAKRHPYVWSTSMSCERSARLVGEYVERRLAGRPARHAGDAGLRTRNRTFGLYSIAASDSEDTCVDLLRGEVTKSSALSQYTYNPDTARIAAEAARGILQFKREGVTTVLLNADVLSTIYLTQAAANQGYAPEWIITGAFSSDLDPVAVLYDQETVDGHMFGLSQFGTLQAAYDEVIPAFEAYTGHPMRKIGSGPYDQLSLVYGLLQAAGPGLTPAALAAGSRTLPPLGGPGYPFGRWYFADAIGGTAAGDHTAVEDTREIYWRGDLRNPVTGKPGLFVATYGGRRFGIGEWPAEEPPVYP